MGLNTQQDPIGFAGGLNVYGYANGDPVNFSDPFGLCPPEDENLDDCPTESEDDLTRLSIYRTLVDNGFSDVISDLVASGVPEVRVGAEGLPLATSGRTARNADGSLAFIQVRPDLQVAVMGATLAHEVVHAGSGPGSSIYEESRAYKRGLAVYSGLGGQGNYNLDRLLAAQANGTFRQAIIGLYPSLRWTLR